MYTVFIYTYCIFWLYNMFFVYIYVVGLHLYLLFTRDSNVVSESSGFKSLQTLTGRLIGYIYIGYFLCFFTDLFKHYSRICLTI